MQDPNEDLEMGHAPETHTDNVPADHNDDVEMVQPLESDSGDQFQLPQAQADQVIVPLQLMATKDTGKRRVCLVDDYSESRKENFAEEKEYKTQNMSGMTVLEKAVCLAETVAKIIQSKQESVMLFSHLNQLLEDKKNEILSELAKAGQLERVNLINAIFMEVIKQTHRETYVQKHLYLKQIVLFCRNVIGNYFIPLMRETAMLSVVQLILNSSMPLFKNLQQHVQVGGTNEVGNNQQASATWQENAKVAWLNAQTKARLQSLREAEEATWRQGLQAGDYVDALCKFETPQCKRGYSRMVQGWQPAKIDKIDAQGVLSVKFLRCPLKMGIEIERESNLIAPKGKYTDAWHWRFDMTVGSEFSCCDEYGNWYRSTVIGINQLAEWDVDGESIPVIRVGFRFLDPEGLKDDEFGRKITGWQNAKFDQDMILALPNIQPLHSMTFTYNNVHSDMCIYEMNIKDIEDVFYPSTEVHQWATTRHDQFAGIQAFAEMINEFGALGGFEVVVQILEEIAEGKFTPLTIDKDKLKPDSAYLITLQTILLKTLPLQTRQFCCRFIHIIEKAYVNAITSKTSSIQHTFNVAEISSLALSYEELLQRNYIKKKFENKSTQLKIKLGSTLLNSDKLERRIAGIKIVNDQVRSLLRNNNSSTTTEEVMQALIAVDIFGQVFDPSRVHLQIVQRSHEIIKIYARSDKLTHTHVKRMWESTRTDETSQIEVYKVLTDASTVIPDNTLEIVVESMKQQLEPQRTTEREVEFIYTVGKNSYHQSNSRQLSIVVLWEIAMLEKPDYSKSLLKLARHRLFDLLRTQDRETVETHILKCIAIIEMKNGASVQAIKLMVKLLQSEKIPKYTYQSAYGHIGYNQRNLPQFVKYLAEEHSLITKLLEDLQNFIDGKSLDEGYPSNKCVWTRLKALMYIQSAADDKTLLTAEMVNQAWGMLVTEKGYTSLFFDWFHQIVSDQTWCTANTDMICQLFQEQVLNNQEKILSQAVHINGFQSIQQLFITVNERQNKLNVISRGQYQSSANHVISNRNDNQKQNKVQFRVHEPPKNLIGIDLIWSLFTKSCEQAQGQDLKAKILDFIAQVYSSTSQLVEDKVAQVYTDFTDKCFANMTDPQFENCRSQLVQHTMFMFDKLFTGVEKVGGTAGIRPHAFMDSDVYMVKNLLITTYLNTTPDQPKHLLLNLPSNMTAWELIDYIARKTNKSPLQIQLSRVSSKMDVNSKHYSLSLRQLNFESEEEVTVIRSSGSMQRVPLINQSNGQLVREAEHIFTSWFNKYSQTPDEIEWFDAEKSIPAERYMSRQKAVDWLQNVVQDRQNYSGTSHAAPKIGLDDPRIGSLFKNYDTDHDNLITLQDFLRFYKIQSNQEPDKVWLNLQAIGYGNNLLREVRKDLSYENDPEVTRDQSQLLRFLISDHPQQLQTLFSLHSADQTTNFQVWQLLSSLKTNTALYQNILTHPQQLENLLIGDKPVFQVLYVLQIMKYLIQKQGSSDQSQQPTARLYLERKPAKPNVIQQAQQEQQEKSSMRKNSDSDSANGQKSNLQGDHWNRPRAAVPSNSDAIALPAAQDQPQQSQKSHNRQQIAQWSGEIIDETISQKPVLENCQIEEHEWFLAFIRQSGFKTLTQLLQHFIKRNLLSVSHADRQCVKLILYMMKVCLMSTFCAEACDQELIGSLMRKMSSTSNQPAPVVQSTGQNQFDNIQNTIQAQFANAVTLLQENQISSSCLLPDDPQMKQLQQILNDLFLNILQSAEVTEEERHIVSECLNIWISLVTFSSSRLLTLYQDQTYLNLLIDQGLLNENSFMRGQFKEAIEYISLRVKQADLPESPAIFFFKQLLSKFHIVIVHSKSDRTCEYFYLLQNLMANYYEIQQKQPMVFQAIYDPQQLVISSLQILNDYKSKESGSTSPVDQTLVGMLNFIRSLITHVPSLLSQEQSSIVLKMLVEKCLFNQKSDEYMFHITAHVSSSGLQHATLNKCHTNESREAAYALFQSLLGNEPDVNVLKSLIDGYWAPNIMALTGKNTIQQFKEKDQRSELGHVGIKNLGCVCYMNAIIQQFYHVPSFRYLLLACDDQQPPAMIQHTAAGHMLDDNSLHQWMKMFGFLELSDRESYNPQDFCFAFKVRGQRTNVREQQDSQEFVTSALDMLEEKMKETPMKYLAQSVFQGVNANIIYCKSCHKITQSDDNFATLSLQVKNQKDIYDSLKLLVAGEVISDYTCSGCNKKVDIVKTQAIKQLPNTLIVHLTRIYFDMDKMGNIKLNDRFEFPNTLNLQEFMLPQVLKTFQKQKKPEAQQNPESQRMETEEGWEEPLPQAEPKQLEEEPEVINPYDYEYKLVGVVIHMGNADAGHYISYVNLDRDSDSAVNTEQWLQTDKQNWVEFNDNLVKKFDFSQLAFKCFGESPLDNKTNNVMSAVDFAEDGQNMQSAYQNAYMLVYEKRVKMPLTLQLNDSILAQVAALQRLNDEQLSSLVCDGTANPRAAQQPLTSHLFYAVPDLARRIANREYDADLKLLIPFHSVRKFIPNEIYRWVDNDNQVKIAESQVFCNPFFKTTSVLLNNLLKHANNNYELMEQIFMLLDRTIFDLLLNTSHNQEIEAMTQVLLELVEKRPPLMMRLINERILFQQKVQGNVCDYPFFEQLIFHREQNAREIHEAILSRVVKVLFTKLEIPQINQLDENEILQFSEILDKLIGITVSLISNKIVSAWHKLGAFFSFFYNCVKDLQWNRLIKFKQEKLVSRLVDFILKIRDHVDINSYVLPIDPALKTISLIARSQPLVIWLYKLPLEQQVTIEEYQAIIQQSGASPYALNSQQQQLFMEPVDVMKLFMTEQRFKALWEVIFANAASNDTHDEVCRLVAHLCYRNIDFSRKIGKMFLAGLNKINVSILKPFAQCIPWFVGIQDEFQMHRIEWLYGIPSIKMHRAQSIYQQESRIQNYKIGCTKIKEVTDQIYEYFTPILKEQSGQHESLLHNMYHYRKQYTPCMLLLLEYTLLTVLQEKDSNALLDFLLSMQGPSYACRRYFDWIEPWILQSIQEDNGAQQETTEAFFKVLALVQQIKSEKKERLEQIFAEPEPYLTWEPLAQTDVLTIQNDAKNFHVRIQETTTTVSKSTPNPAEQTNENIQKVNRGGWSQQPQFVPKAAKKKPSADRKKKGKRGSRVQQQQQQSTRQEAYGRGSRKQPERSRLPPKFEDDDIEIPDGHSGGTGFTGANNNQDIPIIENNIPDLRSADGNSNDAADHWSDRKASNDGSLPGDQDFGYSPANTDEYQGGANGAANFDDDVTPEELEMIKKSEEEEEKRRAAAAELANASSPIKPAGGEDEYMAGNPMEEGKENDMIQFESSEGENSEDQEEDSAETTKRECKTVLCIILRNFNRFNYQTCSLQFKQENKAQCNFRVPAAALNQRVAVQTDHSFMRLAKIRPDEDWGPIEFTFTVDNDDIAGNNVKYANNWPDLREIRVLRMQQQQPMIENQPYQNAEVDNDWGCYDDGVAPATGGNEGGGAVSHIECQICTYHNDPGMTSCEMCQNPL